MPQVSKESANQIVVDFVKKEKNTETVDIAIVEEQRDGWMVRGTFPIDMEGHPWVQKFAVLVDQKGKVRTTDFALL